MTKFAKPILLFYNSVLMLSIITSNLSVPVYRSWGPVLIIMPVVFYFVVELIDEVSGIFIHLRNAKFDQFRKALSIYSFVMVLLYFLANLAASQDLAQATLSIFFLPLLIVFAFKFEDPYVQLQMRLRQVIKVYKVLGRYRKISASKKKKKKGGRAERADVVEAESAGNNETKITALEPMDEKQPEILENDPDILDGRRRQFLKILGGGGVSLIAMLFIMPGKANATFFGSAPGPGVVGIKDIAGNKIDPAEKQPTDGYTISEIAEGVGNNPSYYGFVHKSGAWYIAREASTGAFRYSAGSSGFSTNWTNRASLTYDYFDNVF